MINSPTAIPVGVESKIAMSFDAKTKTTRVYLNGVETINAATFTYEPYQLTAIAANTRNYIGRTQWWDTSVAASNIDYNGTIDDAMLYDIALTPAEIIQVQANPATSVRTPGITSFSLFPNPVSRNADTKINYDFTSNELQNIKVEVINTLGERVQLLQPASSPVSISGLTHSGIYLVRVMSGTDLISVGKLVVQ